MLTTDLPLSDPEWIARFSARLHARWPTIARAQRDEAASEVAAKAHLRCLEPEDAVTEWLRPLLVEDDDVPF
jgi:hypothetical protein